jgi:hypothetical protein
MGALNPGEDTVGHQFMHPDFMNLPGCWGPIAGDTVTGQTTDGEPISSIVGDGSPRWPSWAAFTPLFNGNAYYERPHIRVSYDNQNWARPYALGVQGDTIWAPDPIYDSASFSDGFEFISHHMADVELAIDEDNVMWCIFIIENQAGINPARYWIMGLPSRDGITWDKNDTCHIILDSSKSGTNAPRETMIDCLSPTINYDSTDDGVWEMWTVDIQNHMLGAESTFVLKMISPRLDTCWYHYNGSGIASIDTCSLIPPADTMNIWHIKVRQPPWGGPERFMLATFSNSISGCGNYGQYLYYSENKGIDWAMVGGGPVIPCSESASEFDTKTYRSSFNFEIAEIGWRLPTLYSVRGCAYNSVWGTAFTEIYIRTFLTGDINGDERINILDITYIIAYLYQSGPAPEPLKSADVNSDGAVNILDITYLIEFLYLGGPEPDCP